MEAASDFRLASFVQSAALSLRSLPQRMSKRTSVGTAEGGLQKFPYFPRTLCLSFLFCPRQSCVLTIGSAGSRSGRPLYIFLWFRRFDRRQCEFGACTIGEDFLADFGCDFFTFWPSCSFLLWPSHSCLAFIQIAREESWIRLPGLLAKQE